MNDELYYTPKLEEFHVGFEYEYLGLPDGLGGDAQWIKDIFGSVKPDDTEQMDFDTIKAICNSPEVKNEIRVKYLDNDDIEELLKSIGIKLYFDEDKNAFYHETTYMISWIIPELEHMIYIGWSVKHNADPMSVPFNPPFFHGIIRNKSELKVLFKQLEI